MSLSSERKQFFFFWIKQNETNPTIETHWIYIWCEWTTVRAYSSSLFWILHMCDVVLNIVLKIRSSQHLQFSIWFCCFSYSLIGRAQRQPSKQTVFACKHEPRRYVTQTNTHSTYVRFEPIIVSHSNLFESICCSLMKINSLPVIP